MKYEALIGTSGYNYGSWRGTFYPQNLPTRGWLSYFSSKFQTVEINNSFYVATKLETYKKWHDQTPADFAFVIKGHRMITQYKKLIEVEDSVTEFFDRAKGLQEKLQVVLWQFPASFKLTNEHRVEYLKRFEAFLKLLPKEIKQAIEFRDVSWFGEDVWRLIEKYNASLVYSDSPKFPLLQDRKQTFSYIRFHGPEALYASSYTDMQLKIWAERIKKFREQGNVYIYFNNDIGGHAVKNAEALRELIDAN